MVTKMARNDPQFNLRVPSELKQKVENAAKESGRSINAEAVYRLEQSFEQPMTFSPENAEMMQKIVALSMQSLITELKNEGVEEDKLANAIHQLATN